MQALVLEANNQLTIKEVDTPTLKPGEALVQIKAAALNRRDYWITIGKYAGIKYPTILGSDGAGIVTAVGSETDSGWIGKEVILNPAHYWGDDDNFQGPDFKILGLPEDGTFTEYVKTPVEYLYAKPAHLNWEQAAALPLAGLTAFRALFFKGQAKKGDKVLITGAGSGTGVFALQWAVAAGCEVFVTSGSPEKLAQAKQLGAAAGVSYKAQDWAEQLKELSGGGFNVIVDSAFGAGFAKLPFICRPGARIVFFGATTGNVPDLNGRQIYWHQLQILGTTMGTQQNFKDMVAFAAEHKIVPVIEETVPFNKAADAILAMEHASQFGKVVVSIGI